MDEQALVEDELRARLSERALRGLLRTLSEPTSGVDFCSNDYLGFARLPELARANAALPAGSTGSRLISGNCPQAHAAEQRVAAFHHAEAALIFGSGYVANVGLLSAIATSQDALILDAYCHASLMDGARLSSATRYKFRHNDLNDLEKKLGCAARLRFVVVESVYSMHGDEAPLREMAALCRRHGALLLVDEAHATGVYGPQGEGLVCHYELQDAVYARMHTFGKALGLHGAAVVGSTTLRNYLINYARPFVYTTAPPPDFYLRIDQAYQLLPSADRAALRRCIYHFKERARGLERCVSANDSPIQAIALANSTQAAALAKALRREGLLARAILSPTVPKGHERVRICLHAFNAEAEIDALFSIVHTLLA